MGELLEEWHHGLWKLPCAGPLLRSYETMPWNCLWEQGVWIIGSLGAFTEAWYTAMGNTLYSEHPASRILLVCPLKGVWMFWCDICYVMVPLVLWTFLRLSDP